MKTEERAADTFPRAPEMPRQLSEPAQYDLDLALWRARREIGGVLLAKLLRYLAEVAEQEEAP